MIRKDSRDFLRSRRQKRVRRKVSGSNERPRLAVFRSARHIYAQIIDDTRGKTLISANTLEKEIKDNLKDDMSKTDAAKLVGKVLAEKAKKAGLSMVVFDRAGYKYHGRIAALAASAREAGLEF